MSLVDIYLNLTINTQSNLTDQTINKYTIIDLIKCKKKILNNI